MFKETVNERRKKKVPSSVMINRDSAFICKLKVVKRTRSTAPLSSVIDPSIIPDKIARVKEARYKLSEKNIAKNEKRYEA